MVVYSIACAGRGPKHLRACTGILMPYWGTVTVQKSLGGRAGLGRAWDEKKTLLSSPVSSSSCQLAFQELSSNSDTMTKRLPCCPWWGAVVGLACAFGAACMAGQRWASPAAITASQSGTQATSFGNPWHNWWMNEKSKVKSDYLSFPCSLVLRHPYAPTPTVLGTEDALHPQELSPYAHWLHTTAPGALPERTMM